MSALDKLKKDDNDEVKIVQVDMNNVFGTTLKDDDWDIATRENLERIAEKEALLAAQEDEDVKEIIDEDLPDAKYIVPDFGSITKIPDSIMSNSLELIKVLSKAKDREQWLDILDNAKKEAFDLTLVDYLFENDYKLEEYIRNSEFVDSQVKKITGLFSRFLKIVTNEKSLEKLRELLTSVSFIDDRIIELVVKNKDRNNIIRKNHLMRFDSDKKLFNALVDYEGIKDSKDFSFLNYMALDNLVPADIDKLMSSGYVIDENSPKVLLNDNDLIRKTLLKKYDQDTINLLLTKVNNRPGFCYQIYSFHNKKILSKEFIKVIGIKDVLNIIKYIELSGIIINIDKVIEEDNISKIKRMYDALNNRNIFNRDLFINIINLYESNSELVLSICDENIVKIGEQINLLFSFNDKLYNPDIDGLRNIEKYIYAVQKEDIENNKDTILLKDYICHDLTKKHYLDIHKMIVEILSSNKLMDLRSSFRNEKKKKEVDKYIHLSLFLEKLIDCDNISVLKNIALTVNESVHETKIWIKKIRDIYSEVMNLYIDEINEKMTNVYDYMTNQVFSVDGKSVGYAIIPNDSKFGLFTLTVPYFGSNSNIRNLKNSNFNDNEFENLNGITDEYTRLLVNKGEVVILYNRLQHDSLLSMNNRDMGFNMEDDYYTVQVNSQMNAMPFREIVRNTQQLVTYSYNEYIVRKDMLKPAGVLVFDIPTEDQKDVAAYLNVPLVNIEQITQNVEISNNVKYDVNLINISDDELKEERITQESKNDQFLDLIGSLFEIKGEQKKIPEARFNEDTEEYEIKERGISRIVLPTFRYSDMLQSNIDIDLMRKDRIKSNIFKKLLPKGSINYEFKKVIVDDEIVLSAVYDKVYYEAMDIKEYNITNYLKKLSISYLIGDPFDGDSYHIKQDSICRCNQLFIEVDLLKEYKEEMKEISRAYCDDIINIDFIELIDFIGKIDSMDDVEYLLLFKEFINDFSNTSICSLQEALLEKKHTLIQKMGEVIEKLSKDKGVNLADLT